MITEKDLQEAIAECQGQRNPNANTCIKLASYLTIQRELFGKEEEIIKLPDVPTYSYTPAPTIDYPEDSTFGKLVDGKSLDDVLPLFDELLDTIQLINPRLYDGFIRRLREI